MRCTASGKTYVGWVDLEGDIKVSSYDHASGERVTAVLQARLNQDDHANPSLHVRPDGHLVVFYSRHVGPAMHYRISTRPHDVRSWAAPRTVPTNTAGIRGYTYPNPIRLADGTTFLFWRGGNYNPTFSTQAAGSDTWSPARNLILMPGERPYVKYASSGGDTIHVAYTNAHPSEFPDVNIYYARVRGGAIERADGTAIGSLGGPPIAPGAGDHVFNPTVPTWVHDVAADAQGRPVILFATFPTAADHRYHYARWTGSAWAVREITGAGGSFRGDGGSPYYSGGLTLDHEDPSRVYLSRQVGPGNWQIEAWTTADGGANWVTQPLTPGSTDKNVRPVSPRGMEPFTGDLSAIWMRGRYDSWTNYGTAIAALSTNETNAPPVADAEPAVRSGPAPLEVRFDGSFAHDTDGSIVSWQWDFGDGTPMDSGQEVTHTYAAGGRYFPTLTVTDDQGAQSTLVEEIAVDLPSAPTTYSGGAAGTTVHGAVDPENQATEWSFDYGPTAEYGAITPVRTLPASDGLRQISAELPGLVAGRLYHYRLVATNASGTTEGADRVMVAGRTPGSDAYRDAVLGTPGLAAYWRLGELSGSAARGELSGAAPGAFLGRFVLGQPGVLGPLRDTAASFDGATGELSTQGPALGQNAALEGWFRWRGGTSVVRDHTATGGTGWILAFNSAGRLHYRLGGNGFDTGVPIGAVRDGQWHHLVATKQGPNAALYLDGARIHSGTGAGSAPAAQPWHVMRNGTNNVFSEGEADEVALYDRALSADEVRAHHGLAGALRAEPLPDETPITAVDPPAAGSGAGGGVLRTPAPAKAATGRVWVRGGMLVVRGAPGTGNRLSARRRGHTWRIADAAAPLRAGAGCRRIGPRTVGCRAAGVRRIVMYGGAGADRLTVVGRTRALLVGGPGPDRLTAVGRTRALLDGGPGPDRLVGGPLTRFRGGPGADRVARRRAGR